MAKRNTENKQEVIEKEIVVSEPIETLTETVVEKAVVEIPVEVKEEVKESDVVEKVESAVAPSKQKTVKAEKKEEEVKSTKNITPLYKLSRLERAKYIDIQPKLVDRFGRNYDW